MVLWVALLFFAKAGCGAITNKYTVVLQPRFQYGSILDPCYLFQNLIKGYPKSIQFDVCLQSKGEKYWHKFYRFPKTGLTFFYHDLANDKQLGKLVGFAPFLELKPKLRKFYPSLYMGLGLAYNTKPYDRLDNYKNVMLGSRFNAALKAGGFLNLCLGANWSANAGIAVEHFSCGNTVYPNRGINIASLSSGLSFRFNDKPFQTAQKKTLKQHQFSFTPAISLTNRMKGQYAGFHYYDLLFDFTRAINPAISLGVGFDLSFNDIDSAETINNNLVEPQPPLLGLKLVSLFAFSRLEVLFCLGAEMNGLTPYDWIVLRYRVYKWIKINMSYKSHLLCGDHLGWGLCFSF